MHPHEFHQHLVGVGRSVEGACTRPVVGGHFGFHQLGPPDFACCELLADFGFFVVGEPAFHGSCGQEARWQMPEGLCGDNQPRHDFIADPEEHGGIKGVVAKGYRGGQCDYIA